MEKSYVIRLIIFLVINFGALAIGGFLQGRGAFDGWYQELNKAPWTPPGWMFGAAWFTIMVCFSVYMAKLYTGSSQLLVSLFAVQFLLNVMWNPLFFRWHMVNLSAVVIAGLTILVWFFFFYFRKQGGWYSLLIVPYGVWLIIATSLNVYIIAKN